MKATTRKKAKSMKLPPEKIRALKRLAERIDADEQDEIKEMGRAILRRHRVAREIVAKLKAKRLEIAMSLTELAYRTGIAKPNLSRLENDERISPTLETLQRYAEALGLTMRVEVN